MKDRSKTSLESERPSIPALEAINFCLDQLYKDNTHEIMDDVVKGLTFKELIGALLMARDLAEDDLVDEDEEEEEPEVAWE